MKQTSLKLNVVKVLKKKEPEITVNIRKEDGKGNSDTVRVREISNGFILTKESCCNDGYESVETYYKDNPLLIPTETLAAIFEDED